MQNFEFEVTAENGIHARPAGLLVKEATNFTSGINLKIKRNEEIKSTSAKSIFGLMGLGVKQGEIIFIEIQGKDEKLAAKKISSFLNENF